MALALVLFRGSSVSTPPPTQRSTPPLHLRQFLTRPEVAGAALGAAFVMNSPQLVPRRKDKAQVEFLANQSLSWYVAKNQDLRIATLLKLFTGDQPLPEQR